MNETRNPKAGRTGILFTHANALYVKTETRNPKARRAGIFM